MGEGGNFVFRRGRLYYRSRLCSGDVVYILCKWGCAKCKKSRILFGYGNQAESIGFERKSTVAVVIQAHLLTFKHLKTYKRQVALKTANIKEIFYSKTKQDKVVNTLSLFFI
jgi:hypothetical protein